MKQLNQYELREKLDKISIIGSDGSIEESVVMVEITKKEDEVTQNEYVTLRGVVENTDWEFKGFQFNSKFQTTYAVYKR